MDQVDQGGRQAVTKRMQAFPQASFLPIAPNNAAAIF